MPLFYRWGNGGPVRVNGAFVSSHDSVLGPGLSASLPVSPQTPGTESSSTYPGHTVPKQNQSSVTKDKDRGWCLLQWQWINAFNSYKSKRERRKSPKSSYVKKRKKYKWTKKKLNSKIKHMQVRKVHLFVPYHMVKIEDNALENTAWECVLPESRDQLLFSPSYPYHVASGLANS